jgi:hypothetical protein
MDSPASGSGVVVGLAVGAGEAVALGVAVAVGMAVGVTVGLDVAVGASVGLAARVAVAVTGDATAGLAVGGAGLGVMAAIKTGGVSPPASAHATIKEAASKSGATRRAIFGRMVMMTSAVGIGLESSP